MRAEDIVGLLRAQPFVPFRIHMTDGREYDIDHPELVFVLRNYLEIGIPSRKEGVMLRSERCSLLHIMRIDYIERESTQSKN